MSLYHDNHHVRQRLLGVTVYLTVSSRRVAMLFLLIRLNTQMRLTPQMAFSGTVEQHQARWCSIKSSLVMSFDFTGCASTLKACNPNNIGRIATLNSSESVYKYTFRFFFSI